MPQTEKTEDNSLPLHRGPYTSMLDDPAPPERHCRHYEGYLATAPTTESDGETARFSYMDLDVTIFDKLKVDDLAHMVMDAQGQDTLDASHAIRDSIRQVSDVRWAHRTIDPRRLVVHLPSRG